MKCINHSTANRTEPNSARPCMATSSGAMVAPGGTAGSGGRLGSQGYGQTRLVDPGLMRSERCVRSRDGASGSGHSGLSSSKGGGSGTGFGPVVQTLQADRRSADQRGGRRADRKLIVPVRPLVPFSFQNKSISVRSRPSV